MKLEHSCYTINMENISQSTTSLEMAKAYLGKKVTVVMDRPLGSTHPKHGFLYEVNYGFIKDTTAPDGEELDAYFLGVNDPLETAEGVCLAIAHRNDDDDDKLIVVPENVNMSDEEILSAIKFQEQFFDTVILR